MLALRLHPQIRTVLFEVSIWNVCSMKLHPFWTFPLALYKGYPTAGGRLPAFLGDGRPLLAKAAYKYLK